jgi:uncharacterized protein YbjT (DUF2867 family)
MNSHEPILVIGGTRGTGLLIARLLHRQGCPVRVLARDRERAMTLFDPSVQVVEGDLTKPKTLGPAIGGAKHMVFTAGCRSGYPVREPQVKAVEYEGVLNTLAAARQLGFAGRFLYMNSSGLTTPSMFATFLNLWKGNTLIWRWRVEQEIRASGLHYTIIRTGVLLNRPGGQHAINVTQQSLPLSMRYRIARADVAQVFLTALEHPCAERATFEAVWGRRGGPEAGSGLLDRLQPDAPSTTTGLRPAAFAEFRNPHNHEHNL